MYQRVYPQEKKLERDQSEEGLIIRSFEDREPLVSGRADIFITSQHTEWLDDFQFKELQEEDEDTESKSKNIYAGILRLRRISRVCLLGFGLLVILTVFLIGHIVSMSSGTWESSVANKLTIRQGNCLINIHNHDQQNIKVEYTQKGSMLSAIYQKDYGMSGFNQFSEKEGTVELAFINYIQNDIKDCIVSLYLPSTMQSLDFRCMDNTQCYYVSHDSLIATGINFTSESYSSLYVNSKTIQTDSLNYNSTKGGALYLNHLISANVNIYSFTGPILIQSTQDFEVAFTSNSSSYCSSSIYIDGTSTNCDNSSSTICSGLIKQCQSSNCNSTLQKYKISTIYGTIYSNLIQKMGEFNDNMQIYKSVTFDQDIEFDIVSTQQINSIKQEAFVEADLIVKVSIGGNLLLQHSQNTFWVYFSNSAYAAFQPWWLSFFSATFLTAQTFDVDLQIQNYFCPHTQVITLEQAYQISNLIFKQFNQNVGSEGVSYINKKDKPLPSYHPNFNMTGIEELPIRSFFTSESWYNIKLNHQLIEWHTLVYEPTFIAIIILSLLSALILAAIIDTLLVAFLMELECQTIKSVEQIQNYKNSQSNQQEKKSDLSAVMKQALQRIGNQLGVKYFFSLMSYQIYLYQRQHNSSSQGLFLKSLFRYQPGKNYEGKQRLNDKQLKEMYDKFCYLCHCPTEPLKDKLYLLQRYGFDLKENVGNLGLAKIRLKNKITTPNYSKLTDLEKQGNPVDQFFLTQFDFTGIMSDQIDSKDINRQYQQFMDEGAKFQVINLVDAAEKYNLALVNLTSQELVKNTTSTNYIINPHFEMVLEIMSDPLRIIKSDISDSDLYTQFYIFKETVKYNSSNFLKPYTHYDIMDDREAFLNILDVIYPQRWFFTDILITINFYFLIFLQLLPTLFFLILISTSYAPYSLNHPKSLLFAEDMLLRPWSLYIYTLYIDPIITSFIIIFILYFIASICLEMKKNTVVQYPEDMGFLNQVKNSGSVYIQSILNIQWGIFITGITIGLVYICLVMEWLLLGAIINPNNFLVYASSVATLIATILQQISQAKSTYEFGKRIVLEYINKNYLSNVTLIASSLMQESLNLGNQIQLPTLGEAFSYAEKAGFGAELRDLCTKDINFFEQDQPGANSIEKLRQDYQKLKDNLFEKIVNKCSFELQQNFKMDKNLSEVLASINFKKFDDVEDNLARAIEEVTKKAIPGFVIKWVLKSTELIMNAEQSEKMPISKLLLELVGKILMKDDVTNPKMEQILSITIQYLYEFSFNDNNIEKLLEAFYNEIKLFTNEDVTNKDILLLKYFMEFFLIIVNEPRNAQNRINEIINNISSLMEIEELIKFILSFLFQSENDQTFRLGNKTISEPNIIEEYLITFIENYQLEKYEIGRISLLIKIAIRFLKMNRLQIDKIFTTHPIASDKGKSYYYSTFLSNILQLASRNWEQTFARKFRNYDINDQIVVDTFFISSKFLWNQKDLMRMDFQFQLQQIKYQKNDQDSQFDSNILKGQAQEFASQPRFEKLSDRKLTRLIANAMGMNIDQIIGCAVFLKGECDIVSKQLSSFYNYLFQEIMSIKKAEYEPLFRFFDLMSCSQFELVPYKVKLLGEDALTEFTNLFLNPQDQQTLWIFHPDFTQDEKLKKFLKSDVRFINDPIANHYKADRCSFYGYIKCELKGENVKIKEKARFYNFLINKFKCKMSIATLFFDLQNSFLQNRSEINQINLTPLNGVKIRQEAFLKFLYLQDFNRPKHMAEAIMYFINQDPEEKQKNYNEEVIAEHLNYFINIENTVNEMEVEIPSQIPFYYQHLRFLFVNKILSTKIPVLDSSVQCWVKYGIKFLLDHKILKAEDVDTTLSWVNLYFKLQMDGEIKPVRNIVKLYGQNSIWQYEIYEFIDNQINQKFSLNLLSYFQHYFDNYTLLKKTLRLIEGLAQVSHESNSSLTWIGNRIKYFFTLDQDCFSDFAIETVQKLVNQPNSDYKSIRVFFSIFDLNPDYAILNRFYGLKESTVRIIKFLSQAMTYKDKQIIIDRWSKDQPLLNALQNQLSIHNGDLLFNQLRLLNSDITDLGLIIQILRIDSNPNLAIIYMQLLSFHLRDYHQDVFEVKKEQENILAQIRLQVTSYIIPQIEPTSIEIMELLHWFANPDPLSLIIKLTQNQGLQTVFLSTKDQDICGLFIGSIVSISKQDPQCIFSRLSIRSIRNQSALTKQLSYPKFLDMLGKSSSTLFRSALGLLKIFGIEPLLTLGILHDNLENKMMNTLYSAQQLKGIQSLVNQISNQLSPLQIFQIIDQEFNEPQIGMEEIINFPKPWNKNEEFSKKYPKSTIIFLLACKEIRNLLVYQKCKDKSQLYLVVSHYMDMILTYFDLYQQYINSSFDKNLLNHIISIGLCTSSTLYCKQQIVNFNFLYQESLMLPPLRDLKQFGQIQEKDDKYWILFNEINSKIKKLDFEGIVDEQINILLEQFLKFKNVNKAPESFGVEKLQIFNVNSTQKEQLRVLYYMVSFPYHKLSYLITKYPNKTLILLKQQILSKLVSEDQLDLLDNHTTQNYDKLITYFIKYVTDKPKLDRKKIDIKQSFKFLYNLEEQSEEITKMNFSNESIGLIPFLDQLNSVAGDWHIENSYSMIIVAFYEPQSFDLYARNLDKIDDPEIVATLMKLCLKYNLELNKLDFSSISQIYSYYQFDIGDNEVEKGQDDKNSLLKIQSLKLNQGIEKILAKYQGLNVDERIGIKLLIRAFLGDIEAWYLLYQKVKLKYELFKQHENRFEKKNSNQFLLTFLSQLKQKQLRSHRYSRNYIENYSGLKIIMESQKDYIVSLLKYLTDTIPTYAEFDKKYENILEFMKLVLLQKVEYINEKSMVILNISEKKLQVVAQLILFIIHNDRNSDTSQEFKRLEILIQEQKIFEGNQKYSWLMIKFIYMIKQTDDFNILIEQIIALFQSQPEFNKYSKYLCLLISLSVWINIKYTKKAFPQIEQLGLSQALKEVLGYAYQWVNNKQLEGNPEQFIIILKLFNKNVNDPDDCLFSDDQKIYECLPDELRVLLDDYFGLDQHSQASQELIKVLHHKINSQGLGSGVKHNYKPIIDIIKQKNQAISPQLDIFVEGMPKLFNENISPGKKIVELSRQFGLFCNSKPLQELLTLQSKILIDAPNKYDRMFEIFCSICNIKNDQIKTNDLINLVFQIFQIHNTLTGLMHTEKSEQLIFRKIVEQLQTLKMNEKPIFDKNILIVFEGIYALKYKQFDKISREFFQLMLTTKQNEIKEQLMMVSQALSKPLSQIINTETLFNDKSLVTKVQHLGNISQKLISGQNIMFEDMFKLIDQSGTRFITGEQLHNFLTRTGIQISDHKMQEILVKVMGDSVVDTKTVKIDFRRFEMAFQQIQDQTLSLALDYLGISKQLLIQAVITIVFYLLILIIFILIGIQAFSIPGTFGSIINSLLPALGGLGLSKRSSNHKNKLLDLERIEEIVRKSIEIIQSSRI